MIKERIPISGDLKSKVKQLMEYAGWQEGRKVDISIAEKYYADHGVPMMKTTQRFYRKYFGLCCEWYLEQKKLNWAADFQFALFPYLVNGIKNHLEEAYFPIRFVPLPGQRDQKPFGRSLFSGYVRL